VLVGVALAATMLPSLAGAADVPALELFADLLLLPVLPVFVFAALQPASTSMTNASKATNLIFMGCLLFCREMPLMTACSNIRQPRGNLKNYA
jgi:hypothetical protein